MDISLSNPFILKMLLFVISGLGGMLYAYCWRWVEQPTSTKLYSYLFGNPKAVLKAILIFIGACVGTISLDYFNNLDNIHIIIAGSGLGLLIPEKVDNKENNTI